MSFDNQATLNIPNMEPSQPKSNTLKWVLGGCGCLGLLAAICIGGFIFWIGPTIGDAIRMQQEIQSLVQSSPQVQEALGSPVTIDGNRSTNGPQGEVTLEFDVSGPKGNGTIYSKAKVDPSTMRLERQGLYLEVDGQRIDLNPEAEFDLDVEGLDE